MRDPSLRSRMTRSGGFVYFCSSKLSRATLTASITKAEKVQFFPCIAFSTFSIISFGKRMHLFVVGGTDGILKSLISSPLCIAIVLHNMK